MSYPTSPNGSAGGRSSPYAANSGISPLTCTIFDPTKLGVILRNHVFHISPTRLKNPIMGIFTSTSGLKLHTGETQALTGVRES